MDKPTIVVHAYPVYVDDWRGSETRMETTLEQRMLLWELIFYCFKEGSLPTDEAKLKKIADCSDAEWKRSWPKIKHKFEERDGRLHHARVDGEMARIAESKQRAAVSGRNGAQKRWGAYSKPMATPLKPDSGQLQQPQCDPIASFSSPTPNPHHSPSHRDTSTESDTETRYVAFRDSYPIDRRKDTALARQYYVQATGGLEAKHDRLMAALRTYVSRTEARFVQNMERWLESPPWHLADQAPDGELRVVARDMDHLRQLIAEGKYKSS